jgi:hypothetical protein
MSEANVETLRRWVNAYNERDLHGLLELSDPDIEFRSLFAATIGRRLPRPPRRV